LLIMTGGALVILQNELAREVREQTNIGIIAKWLSFNTVPQDEFTSRNPLSGLNS